MQQQITPLRAPNCGCDHSVARGLLHSSLNGQRYVPSHCRFTLEFFLYAVRQPELHAELAQRFETTRQQLADSLEPHRAGHDKPALTSTELAVIAVAAIYGLGVQAVLDHTAIPPDLYQRMMAKLLG